MPAPAPQTEIMSTAGYGDETAVHGRATLGGTVARAFSDKRGSISRPKLLFVVAGLDVMLITLAGLITLLPTGSGAKAAMGLPSILLVALAAVTMLQGNWTYTISGLGKVSSQAERIVRSLVTVSCLLVGTAYLAGAPLLPSRCALSWLVLAVSLLVLARFAIAGMLDRMARRGSLVRRTVIVGGGPEAEALIRTLEAEQNHHMQILGIFDDRQDERSSDTLLGYPKLGTFEQLSMFCRNAGVDLLVVTVPFSAEQRLLQILARLFTIPADIRISAQGSKLRLDARAYSFIGSVPMLTVMDRPLNDWARAVKNIEDRVIGALLLMLAAPVMALVALAIRLDSRGPVFFKQRRYGFNNELIEVWKFRSMYADMSDADASRLATRSDPRVTRVGRFIRRASLDELPQLFNVLLGEMSLVGPRPHATGAKASDDLYQSVVDGYFARHRVKPGVTGWAQVKGWRGETDTHEKIQKRVEHDIYYIDNWSLPLDLYIIALTPLSLLTGKNAY